MGEISIGVLMCIVVSHFIGDFVMQSNRMATNKSKDVAILTLHTIVYGLPFLWLGIYFYVLTVILHWFVDFSTSRIASYFAGINNRYMFLVTTGIDQTLHMFALLYAYYVLIN